MNSQQQIAIEAIGDAILYKSSQERQDMLDFIIRCRGLAHFNAMLVFLQNPKIQVALTRNDWKKKFNRGVKKTARNYIILWPFSPVSIAYDYEDTYPLQEDEESQKYEEWFQKYKDMYKPESGNFAKYLEDIDQYLAYYGIALEQTMVERTEYSANITLYPEKKSVQILLKNKKAPQLVIQHKAYFLININEKAQDGEKLTAIIHELAHLFLRHLKCPNEFQGGKIWDTRLVGAENLQEIEAELTKILVCSQLCIDDYDNSIKYIAEFVEKNSDIDKINLTLITRVAETIEKLLNGKYTYKNGFLYKYIATVKNRINAFMEMK